MLDAGNARVYATDFTDGTVTAVDTATGAIVYSTQAGDRPSALALSPDGLWLYVLVGGEGVLAVLDSATGSRVNAIPVGTLARELLVGDGGRVYVTGPEPERVVILDR